MTVGMCLLVFPLRLASAQSAAAPGEQRPLSRQQLVTYWTETAEAYRQQGRWLEAEELLDQAIAAQHDLVPAYLMRARVREQQNNLPGAATDYSSVIHLAPEHYEARFQRALLYFASQRYSEAQIDFLFLLAHPSTETNSVYFQGEDQNGSFVSTGVTTLQSGMQTEWLNSVGLTYWHAGDYALAQDYFCQAVALDSTHAASYLNLGITAEAQHDTVKAKAYYQQVLVQQPDNPTALRNLASLARQQRDTTLLSTLNETYDAESYEGSVQQGLTCLDQDDFQGAIRKFTQALEWQPHSGEARLQRGFAHEKAGNYVEALNDYSMVIQSDPASEKAYSNRGNVYFRRERYELAVTDYTSALTLNPGNALALYNRAVAYQRLGQLDQACQDWQRAQRLGNPAAACPLVSLCEP